MEAKKINTTKVKNGDLMAIVTYVKVNSKYSDGSRLSVVDVDNSQVFDVLGKGLIERMLSADQFDNEEKVTKTKAAEILSTSFNKPLTVAFLKQDSSIRVLRGRLVQPEPLMGRSLLQDLDISRESNFRQADHRDLLYVIVDNTKFTVGK